jgi:hypothetical protein
MLQRGMLTELLTLYKAYPGNISAQHLYTACKEAMGSMETLIGEPTALKHLECLFSRVPRNSFEQPVRQAHLAC